MREIEFYRNVFPNDTLSKIRNIIRDMHFRYMTHTTDYDKYFGKNISNPQIQDYSCMINSLYHEKLKMAGDPAYKPIIDEFKKHLPNVFNGYTVRRMNINLIPNAPNANHEKFSVPHQDDFPDVGEEFKTILFYAYPSDGDTFFFANTPDDNYLNPYNDQNIDNIKFEIAHRQSPESNMAVVFDSTQLHGSQPPKLSRERIVINIVLRKKKMGSIDVLEPFRTPIFEFENFINDAECAGLESKILSYKSKSTGRKYSNYGGWQSNLFLKDSYPIELQAFIMKIQFAVDSCFETIGINTCNRENSQTLGNVNCFWYNVNSRGDWNYPHTHPGNVFAAVLYVKCDDNSGDLIFDRPDIMGEYYANRISGDTEYSKTQFRIKPKQGSMVVFPAWMKHSVEPSKSDITRISIAFNID